MLSKFFSSTLIASAIIISTLFSGSSFAGDHDKDSPKDIVTIAVESGKFNTLAKALTETGLVEALKGDGPFCTN